MRTTHVPTTGSLVGVWVVLVILTWTTVGVSYLELGPWNLVVALTIAVIKASCVAWIFMGVRYSTTLTRLFVVAGLVWLTIMIIITSSDYATRRWDYQPRPWATTKDVATQP
ncbi:MAG: cytochrome C oxidase subunit IV family protein [Acidobacteriaceae bacterium]|nr:cytochrome C oxidase subunit IV family protein [Acidobacteriaceae bacterium]